MTPHIVAAICAWLSWREYQAFRRESATTWRDSDMDLFMLSFVFAVIAGLIEAVCWL